MENNSSSKSSGKIFLLVICIAFGFYLLYFSSLGKSPLMDPDEPVYGQVAKEMAAGAGWLTPHYDGKPWFDKPPLFYWLSGISAKVLGPNELASRLPSAVLAVALVLLLYALVKYDFGRRAGMISAVVMATCLQQIVLARAAVTDMTFVFCLLLALYGYRRWLDAEGLARFAWMAFCGAATGLGLMAKGPVAPFLLFVTFCIHLIWIKKAKRLATSDAAIGVMAALLVGLPWYIAMYKLHGNDFVQGFLVANNVKRFLKAEHAKQTGKWFSLFMNFPILAALFFPWSIFLIQAIRKCGKINDGAKLALVWFLSVFVFFSLSKTLLVTYIFPLYPAAALLVGVFLDRSISATENPSGGMRSALWVGLFVSVAIAIGLKIAAHKSFHQAENSFLIADLLLAATFIVALIHAYSRNSDRSFSPIWVIGTGMAVFAFWLMWAVAPTVGNSLSTRVFADRVTLTPQTRLISFDMECPSALFYMGKLPERMTDPAEVNRLLESKSPVYVITKKKKAPRLRVQKASVVRSGDLMLLTNIH